MNDQRTDVITVSLVEDYDLVAAGLCHLFADHPPLNLVEEAPGTPTSADIVLYDAFRQGTLDVDTVRTLLKQPSLGQVVVYTWDLDLHRINEAVDAGVHGCLSKRLGGGQLCNSLFRIHDGEVVVADGVAVERARPHGGRPDVGSWPPRRSLAPAPLESLSPRETEVLAHIAQGLTNREIAQHMFVSINSVKTYIRMAYRKIQATRRSQAVLWALDHGLVQRLDDRVRGAA